MRHNPSFPNRYARTAAGSSAVLAAVFLAIGAVVGAVGVVLAAVLTVQLFLNADPPIGGFVFGSMILLGVIVLTVIAAASIWFLAVTISLVFLIPAMLWWEWFLRLGKHHTRNLESVGYFVVGAGVTGVLTVFSSLAVNLLAENGTWVPIAGTIVAFVGCMAVLANGAVILRRK